MSGDEIEELSARVDALEEQYGGITILTPYQIKVVIWTARIVSGLTAVSVTALGFSGLITAWEKIGGVLK